MMQMSRVPLSRTCVDLPWYGNRTSFYPLTFHILAWHNERNNCLFIRAARLLFYALLPDAYYPYTERRARKGRQNGREYILVLESGLCS